MYRCTVGLWAQSLWANAPLQSLGLVRSVLRWAARRETTRRRDGPDRSGSTRSSVRDASSAVQQLLLSLHEEHW